MHIYSHTCSDSIEEFLVIVLVREHSKTADQSRLLSANVVSQRIVISLIWYHIYTHKTFAAGSILE